jgi:hypothetical protein
MISKEKIYQKFLSIVQEKILQEQQSLNDLKYSASNETKSTAGDKHETALAMLQIEQANAGKKLEILQIQKGLLRQNEANVIHKKVQQGSVIKTDKGYFYMSAALGKTTIDSQVIIAISPQSPIGAALMNLAVSDSIMVNGNNYLIEEIF